MRISAWFFLGAWFLYQLVRGELRALRRGANGGGVAFFAHVGGFIFGVAVALVLATLGASPRSTRDKRFASPRERLTDSELSATAQRPHRCRVTNAVDDFADR